MKRLCKNCGVQIVSDETFCTSCGTRMTGVQEVNGGTIVSRRNITIGMTVLLVFIGLVISIPYLLALSKNQEDSIIESVDGQLYAGRAIYINGEGFGDYNPQSSKVTINGMDAPVITWEGSNVKVIVPDGVTAGRKEIILSNYPYYDKMSIQMKFSKLSETELARGVVSPFEDDVIEGDGFALYVPRGSVSKEQEIIIYKYNSPSMDDNPYFTVAEEYEVTGPDGGHVFFDKPVYFGLDVSDEEEALRSNIQLFDEYMGEWVDSEVLYNAGDGKLYMVTEHFSGFRRCVNDMYQGVKSVVGRKVDAAVVKGKSSIKYVYDVGKGAYDFTADIAEEAWTLVKDTTTEDFIGVSDTDKTFTVFYRVSDAANDASIPEKARHMVAAFVYAYGEYRDLFGEDNVPAVKRKVWIPDSSGELVHDFSTLGPSKFTLVPDPIKVYIDPRYNKSGAKYSLVSGNITMPSEYKTDIALTCAHELFHAVQYKQLGKKQIYMANGLKDIDGTWTSGHADVYRIFSDNKWFLEATAEYASRFVGTSQGHGASIHNGLNASLPYYAFNSYHEYGVSSFLDYLVTSRQTNEENRKQEFQALWNDVSQNYSITADINENLNRYVTDKLGESTQTLYETFWKEAFTCLKMPDPSFLAGGVSNFINMARAGGSGSSGRMEIRKNGVGIFRYLMNQNSLPKDDTALTRSFWFEASPVGVVGEVYVIPGLDISERLESTPSPAGYVNMRDEILREALIQYVLGESFGIIAYFKSMPAADTDARVSLRSTALVWDNQGAIEEKVKNTTLARNDKLIFTPSLPKQDSGEPPFTAVVVLNNNVDYKTMIDTVETGKAFEVNSPMKDIPPADISVNIQIYQDGKLIHEYQSERVKAEATEKDEMPVDSNLEQTGSDTVPSPSDEPEYAWVLVDTKDFEEAESWENAKKHELYDLDYSYGRGSYSATTIYTGRSEDWRNPPKKNGENLGLNAVYSSPPQIIYPDKPVSMTLSFSVTANGLSFYTFSGAASASFDEPDIRPGSASRNVIRFVNEDGSHSFVINAANGYASMNETLTAQLESGKEGQRKALRTTFYMGVSMGTNYVYEWKQVNGS